MTPKVDSGLLAKALKPPNGDSWFDVIKQAMPVIGFLICATWWLANTMETKEAAEQRSVKAEAGAMERAKDLLERVQLQREAQLVPLQVKIEQHVKDIGAIKEDISGIERDLKTLLAREPK